MKNGDLFPAWWSILTGRRPFLSIEITRECPLSCPGCYAYNPEHLGGSVSLRDLRDAKGQALIDGILALVRRYRPLHVSVVGGEPLVRYRELEVVLPKLSAMGIEILLVTSAVRPIPESWKEVPKLNVAVSIDGLPAEHDRRRAPATYERILKHVHGHKYVVHCTITRQLLRRAGYLDEFATFWSAQQGLRKIWFSLYTPQEGEQSPERLTPGDRQEVVKTLTQLRRQFPLVEMPDRVLKGFAAPPESPEQCMFAQATSCISADLTTGITPCQFGGRPVCSECGCVASAGLAAFANYKLAGLVQIGGIFSFSRKIGDRWAAATS